MHFLIWYEQLKQLIFNGKMSLEYVFPTRQNYQPDNGETPRFKKKNQWIRFQRIKLPNLNRQLNPKQYFKQIMIFSATRIQEETHQRRTLWCGSWARAQERSWGASCHQLTWRYSSLRRDRIRWIVFRTQDWSLVRDEALPDRDTSSLLRVCHNYNSYDVRNGRDGDGDGEATSPTGDVSRGTRKRLNVDCRVLLETFLHFTRLYRMVIDPMWRQFIR
jgi:hypothetical protein